MPRCLAIRTQGVHNGGCGTGAWGSPAKSHSNTNNPSRRTLMNQRLLGLAAAIALILSATLAHADQITGYVRNINPTKNTFAVGDTVFTAAPNNTVGTPLH